MTDPAMVDAILEDRRPLGWTRERAERYVDRYEEWLEELERGEAWKRYDEVEVRRFLDNGVQRVGRMSAVYGPQGRGKSNLCSVTAELVLACRPDWEVYSSVPYSWYRGVGKAPDRLHVADSMSQLLRVFSEAILAEKGDAAVILDEFDQVDTSHTWATEDSESWSRFVNVKRHYQARGPLVVFHSFNEIPLGIRSGAKGSAFKLIARGGEHALIDLEDPSEWKATIPVSTLPYLSYGLLGFALDVDMAELLQKFRGDSFRADQRSVAEVTLHFLNELEAQRAVDTAHDLEVLAEAEGESLAEFKQNQIENRRAWVQRDVEIMRVLRERPDATNGELIPVFHTSDRHLAMLRKRVRDEEQDRKTVVEGRATASPTTDEARA
jgi:hypothetical protein